MILSNHKRVLGILLGILSLSYPLVLYFFKDKFSAFTLMVVMISLLFIRSIPPLLDRKMPSLFFPLGVGVFMVGLYWIQGDHTPLLYPAVMSLAIAVTFSATVIYPPSMIERFARITEPYLDERGRQYTRTVTIVWIIFCLFNAAISIATVFLNDIKLWALYNGCISYTLMGLLMGGEYIFRRLLKAKNNNK